MATEEEDSRSHGPDVEIINDSSGEESEAESSETELGEGVAMNSNTKLITITYIRTAL